MGIGRTAGGSSETAIDGDEKVLAGNQNGGLGARENEWRNSLIETKARKTLKQRKRGERERGRKKMAKERAFKD